MRTLLLGLSALCFVSVTRPAEAYTLLGAETLGVRDYGLHVQVGYPGIDARFHLPLLEDLEVIPRFGLYYGSPVGGFATAVGNALGADFRWQLLDHDKLHVALRWELALYLNYHPDFSAGMRFGIPVTGVVDYEITSDARLIGSAGVAFAALFDPGVFIVPIEFGFGTEIKLTDRFNLTALIEVGPTIWAANGASITELGLKAQVGIGWLL